MHSARVVDASPVWWTQLESGIHWLLDVFVWGYEWDLPILFLSALLQVDWPAARLCFQHLLVCCDLSYLPVRKFSRGGGRWPECGSIAVHNFAAVVILLFRFWIPCNIYVYHIGCAEQAVARRSEWTCAIGDFDSERCWTGCCGLAICILLDA